MALVSSGSVAPSYPCAQNTSSALSSASSASNCRVRPDGMATSCRKKCDRPLTGAWPAPVHFHCTERYRKFKIGDKYVQATRGQGGGGDRGVQGHRGRDCQAP